MSTPPTGYSGTPLAKKLGIVGGSHVLKLHAPEDYLSWLAPLPDGVVFDTQVSGAVDIVHLFADRRAVLQSELADLRQTLRPDAALWVSWPKKAAKVPTDITEDTVRELGPEVGGSQGAAMRPSRWGEVLICSLMHRSP